jgi:hypothetical protein
VMPQFTHRSYNKITRVCFPWVKINRHILTHEPSSVQPQVDLIGGMAIASVQQDE